MFAEANKPSALSITVTHFILHQKALAFKQTFQETNSRPRSKDHHQPAINYRLITENKIIVRSFKQNTATRKNAHWGSI